MFADHFSVVVADLVREGRIEGSHDGTVGLDAPQDLPDDDAPGLFRSVFHMQCDAIRRADGAEGIGPFGAAFGKNFRIGIEDGANSAASGDQQRMASNRSVNTGDGALAILSEQCGDAAQIGEIFIKSCERDELHSEHGHTAAIGSLFEDLLSGETTKQGADALHQFGFVEMVPVDRSGQRAMAEHEVEVFAAAVVVELARTAASDGVDARRLSQGVGGFDDEVVFTKSGFLEDGFERFDVLRFCPMASAHDGDFVGLQMVGLVEAHQKERQHLYGFGRGAQEDAAVRVARCGYERAVRDDGDVAFVRALRISIAIFDGKHRTSFLGRKAMTSAATAMPPMTSA